MSAAPAITQNPRHTTEFRPPSKWNVVFLNDDTTPMDYVIKVLMGVYGHSTASAEDIMLSVHHAGKGVAGTYSHEIAEQKSEETMADSRSYGYTLQVIIEKE